MTFGRISFTFAYISTTFPCFSFLLLVFQLFARQHCGGLGRLLKACTVQVGKMNLVNCVVQGLERPCACVLCGLTKPDGQRGGAVGGCEQQLEVVLTVRFPFRCISMIFACISITFACIAIIFDCISISFACPIYILVNAITCTAWGVMAIEKPLSLLEAFAN